jgi:hypothetical protein
MSDNVLLKVKMNPTQFPDPSAEDIHVVSKGLEFKAERGEVIKMQGEWEGHKAHILVFLSTKTVRTGRMIGSF